MKLRSLLISLIAATAMATTAVAADAAQPTVIAVINIQQILLDSTAAKSIKEQLEAKQKTFQAEMSKKEDDLQKEDQDLAKQRSVLAPDAFDKKVKDFKTQASAAQKDLQQKRLELENAVSSATGEIQKAVYDIVSAMAKEKGFNMVIPSNQILYADTNMDITQEVLTKLNSKLPKVTVSFKPVTSKGSE